MFKVNNNRPCIMEEETVNTVTFTIIKYSYAIVNISYCDVSSKQYTCNTSIYIHTCMHAYTHMQTQIHTLHTFIFICILSSYSIPKDPSRDYKTNQNQIALQHVKWFTQHTSSSTHRWSKRYKYMYTLRTHHLKYPLMHTHKNS